MNMIGRYASKLSFAMVLVGALGTWETTQDYRTEKAFADHGATAIAEPAETASPGAPYYGNLAFQTKANETITIRASDVPPLIRESFRVVKNVQVQYLPEKPAIRRFTDSHNTAGIKDIIVPATLLLVGLVASWLLMRQRS
jgi:hypothetical protein